MVDEAVADEETTTVRSNNNAYRRDLYALPNHTTEAGTINFVKIYFRCWGGSDDAGWAKPSQKSGIVVTDGTEVALTKDTWVTYSEQWDTNPEDSEAFEWADIDAFQIGISLKAAFDDVQRCTQVYVEVDFTPPAAGRSHGYIIG